MRKTNQKEFRVEKVINKKGDKLYIKCRDYNSFNRWIDKKYIFTQKSVTFHLMIIAKRKFELDWSNYATKSDLKMQQL